MIQPRSYKFLSSNDQSVHAVNGDSGYKDHAKNATHQSSITESYGHGQDTNAYVALHQMDDGLHVGDGVGSSVSIIIIISGQWQVSGPGVSHVGGGDGSPMKSLKITDDIVDVMKTSGRQCSLSLSSKQNV